MLFYARMGLIGGPCQEHESCLQSLCLLICWQDGPATSWQYQAMQSWCMSCLGSDIVILSWTAGWSHCFQGSKAVVMKNQCSRIHLKTNRRALRRK